MSVVKLSINTDAQLKENAQKVLNGMQLNLTTYINMALDQLVKKNGVPFEIVGEMNKDQATQLLKMELAKAIDDIHDGKVLDEQQLAERLGI
ncbi:type II toxin-antitoxin system RelB/DinJ family antitoxin [Lactococcus lactis]|uniref:Damage-inducible protein J n=1 Tax=Lactococcus lactis subsp. lactis A12 TaxID=1137134 RepID=S6ER01_LACLL|nr:type II toxin-antitoxin system RelB/DinJ family antitoxin [Lactococcus lactis]CDG03750.1 Putative uncharacterized protein, Toxin-antitoxin system [Lactococcus lactis subsp. lactis A12]SBW29597.1 Putative uncharacterized protein, Toxin-antitoxin system [Lactococcus lactis subsp. lactis]